MQGTLTNTEPAEVTEDDVEAVLPGAAEAMPTPEEVGRAFDYQQKVERLTQHPKIIQAATIMGTSADATARAVAVLDVNVDDEATTPDIITTLLQKAVEAMRQGADEAQSDLARALEPNTNPLFQPDEKLALKGCWFRVVKTQGALLLLQYTGLTSAMDKKIKLADRNGKKKKKGHR